MSTEQILTAFLTKINEASEGQGKNSRDYVLAVPTYTTLLERIAYENAAI